MIIRMLKTTIGSEDGKNLHHYYKGLIYRVSCRLAAQFERKGACALLAEDDELPDFRKYEPLEKRKTKHDSVSA